MTLKYLKELDEAKKPGPDGYMTGLSDKDEEKKEKQMKKQGAMDDDDPDAYKEMPGDKKARKEGRVKKSKFTTAYHKKFKKNEMKNLQELDSFIVDLKATKETQRIEDIKNTKLNTRLKTIDEFLGEGIMSDLHLIAGEAKDEDSFVKTFFSDYGDKIKKSKDSEEWVRSLYRDTVNEAYIGPFVFNDKMSDEELKDMYDAALDGYANYSRGFQHPKSKYKQAYQEIEKILKKRGVSVDEAVELVHVYKDGELYGTGELVKGKDKKIKGKKHQLIRFDGSTEDYYPAEDVKLVESINEDYEKHLDRTYGRNRDYSTITVQDLHFQTDAKELEKMKLAYGYRMGGVTSRERIEDADYSLRRFRKDIKYGDGKEVGVFLPGSYAAATSKLGDGPHKKATPKVKWNQRKYDQWIEDVASNDGWKHAYDMAQNAKNTSGLIDWVKKNNREEDPLQIIQWDIEAMAESVNEDRNTKYTKELTKIFRKEFEDFPFGYYQDGKDYQANKRIIIEPEGFNPDGTLFDMKDDWKEDIIRAVRKHKKKWSISPNMGGGLTIHVKESVNEKKELPKEITKHKDIPSWAKYVAQHSDGEWTWYEEAPTMIRFKSGGGAWKQDGNQTYTGVKTDGKDWDKMPTYYYVKNGKVTESTDEKEQTNMEKLQTLESFITEKKKQTNDQSPLSDDGMETGIKNKAKESGVPVGLLRIIMRRGLAAWKSGHRPGATQAQWGYARVNSFLTKQDGTWGGADADIAKKVRDGGHDKKL